MEHFGEQLTNIRNPEIEKRIENGDAYAICDLLEETRGGLNGIYLRELENAIIKTGDIVQIYEFLFLAVDMKVPGFDRERFERIIRESENPKLMCYCMAFVPDTNLELMLESLEESKQAKYMELIRQDEEYEEVFEKVKEIDPDYEEKVEAAKQFDWYPVSLKEFRNLRGNVLALKEQVKATKNPHLITELANYLEYLQEYQEQDCNISDLTALQAELGDPMQCYEYLASVKVEAKQELLKAVVNKGNAKFAYYVHEYVPGLTEEEKEYLKQSIRKNVFDKKYKTLLGGVEREEGGKEWN